MRVRPYDPARDALALYEMAQRQSIALYGAWDPEDPRCYQDPNLPGREAHVLEDDDGTVVAAVVLRQVGEVALILDSAKGTPQERWSWIWKLAVFGGREAYCRGMEGLFVAVDDRLPRHAARLERLLKFEPDKRLHLWWDVRKIFGPVVEKWEAAR